MQLDNIRIVARREYLQRIRSKGFWIGTVIFPFFAIAMTVLPSLLMARSKTSQTIVVLDDTGRVAAQLSSEQPKTTLLKPDGQMRMAKVEFIREVVQPDHKAQEGALNRRVVGKEIDAWIRITAGALTGD